jgi:hypothetical protein
LMDAGRPAIFRHMQTSETRRERLYLILKETAEEIGVLMKHGQSLSGKFDFTQVERRALVRGVFGSMEALLFAMKNEAVLSHEEHGDLQDGEVALAKEISYALDDKGRVVEVPAKLAFRSNFLFAFRAYARSSGREYNVDVQGKFWGALMRSVAVRDRLMHPKSAADLTVTDKELEDVVSAHMWADRCFGEVLLLHVAKDLAEPDE